MYGSSIINGSYQDYKTYNFNLGNFILVQLSYYSKQ